MKDSEMDIDIRGFRVSDEYLESFLKASIENIRERRHHGDNVVLWEQVILIELVARELERKKEKIDGNMDV